MTRKCVTDEQYGQLSRRLGELLRRVDEGAISFERAMKGAQMLVEGKTFSSDVRVCQKTRKPSRRLRVDSKGVIDFTVTSDRTTGQGWVDYCQQNGINLGDIAKSILLSSAFKPTNGITYRIAVLPGKYFKDQDRTTKNILVEGSRRGWKHGKDINLEVACLIRKRFTNQEINAMGLSWIITMHEAIFDSDGNPNLLGVRANDARPWLRTYCACPDFLWLVGNGFAFVVSQVSSK